MVGNGEIVVIAALTPPYEYLFPSSCNPTVSLLISLPQLSRMLTSDGISN